MAEPGSIRQAKELVEKLGKIFPQLDVSRPVAERLQVFDRERGEGRENVVKEDFRVHHSSHFVEHGTPDHEGKIKLKFYRFVFANNTSNSVRL